ncbi:MULTISPECIES: inositol monophosphatase family protein [Vagococcus]|uniref:Inositol-1-monophosphatase n=1 Tax=Vagococcus fluvialis bH819 TaxID=1255619 RepID=A0A1X6WNN7_9ENTE|nr:MULTISPECIES: inositol monophosphatase family protein [Vagococcus]SLM85895.1 Inositol-1-monophosphatase [Vagococcus fluvialis bH819]HCM88262.1 inositol monophosphatase family protein [Vagococcus sp.]
MTNETLMNQVIDWVNEAADQIREKLMLPIEIEEKSSRHDLVTNVDKETETFLVNKIRTFYPEDHILGEEGLGDQLKDTKGRVWIIDPIDGTLNFVKQQENFCIMIGIFVDNVPILGFIYDVIKDEFAYGGRETGVFVNGKPVEKIKNIGLRDGLIGVNGAMFCHNIFKVREIATEAVGVRMLGCAGLDFLNVIRGKQNGYISNLAPWDFSAGVALSEPLGLKCSKFDGSQYDVLGERQYFIVATEKTYNEIVNY